MFDIYAANYGTEVYNNTFYMTERALKGEKLFLFSAASAYETMKFYNNIFYYDGEENVEANTFGDMVQLTGKAIFSMDLVMHQRMIMRVHQICL